GAAAAASARAGAGRSVDGPARTAGTPAPSGAGDTATRARQRTPSTLRHLMRKSESEMRRLQERQATIEAELAEASGDHVALARLGEDLSTVAAEMADAEESWLALAEEAESQGLTT